MAAVSKSYTAVGVSTTLRAVKGDSIAIAASGTYAATLTVERALTPDESAWEVVAGPYNTANATVATTYTAVKPDERVRTRCTAFTSGTMVTSITNTPGIGAGKTAAGDLIVAGALQAGTTRGVATVSAGATLTLTEALHAGKIITLDALAGSVVTLPAATGSGDKYSFLVSVLATSNSHKIQVANTTDVIQGIISTVDSATVTAYVAASTSDTITLNRTTTGSTAIGEYLEIVDYAAGFFFVNGMTSSTGTAATPFSAAV